MVRMIAIIAAIALAANSYALDDAGIQQKLKELKDPDPKVRAAAIAELAPVYFEMMQTIGAALREGSPEVVAEYQKAAQQFSARALKAPAGLPLSPLLEMSRMAARETAAAASCRAFAEAQEIFHRTDWDGDGMLEYAQAFKGNHSLKDQKAGDDVVALVDEAFAEAEGPPGKATPKAGYCFKILTRGVVHKPGKVMQLAGAEIKDFIVNGNMTLGYALIAYPAEYGVTGRRCYMISNAGTVFSCDLGPETHAIVTKMTEYKPDEKWVPTE